MASNRRPRSPYRGGFAYVDARLTDGTIQKLCRLRYTRSASTWGFAIWRASHDDYEDSYLPQQLASRRGGVTEVEPARGVQAVLG